MNKKFRAASLLLTLTLLSSMVFATPAFAAETDPTTITSEGLDAVQTLELNTRSTYDVELSNEEATLTAQSSDDTVLKASLEADTQNPGYFTLTLEAWKAGEATVTLKASDGTTKAQDITVEDTGVSPNYTVTSDTTDFALPSQNSRYITLHYESDDIDAVTVPTLSSSDDSIVHVEKVGADYDNNNYYFRIDALGGDGKTATLSMGSSGYLPTEKLCTVTIAANKDLSLDTVSTYVCNVYDTYRFIAYTKAATPPEAKAVNDLVSVDYVGPVNGGYEYEMNVNDTEGDSLVEVRQGEETSSFAVKINYSEQPSVVSNDPKTVEVEQGGTYTYHFAIMGGGEPQFVTDPSDAVTVQSIKKVGIDYFCTVAANGDPGTSSELYVTFPNGGDDSFTVDVGTIQVTEQKGTHMESDTNSDFTVAYGKSYTFQITGATQFYAGSSGVFNVVKAGTSDKGTLYKITAVGKPGSAAGFYMSAPDRTVKVCTVTVGDVSLTSDTNQNFSLAKGTSYQYKITAPGITNPSDIHFMTGSSGVLQAAFVKRSGDDFYYKVTATGAPGLQTGVYVSVLDQPSRKLNVVTVKTIDVKSDTNSDFSLAQGKSYQFKITAPGASSVNFHAGSTGVVSIAQVSHSGSDFFFKVTAVGKAGQSAGIYASAPNQDAKKICAITVK